MKQQSTDRHVIQLWLIISGF